MICEIKTNSKACCQTTSLSNVKGKWIKLKLMAILVKVYFFKCQKLCSYACLFQLEIIIQPQIMNRL